MAEYQLDEARPDLPSGSESSGIEAVWIAPTASVIGRVRLRTGASVWYGAVLRGDNELIDVGENSNIQDNCVGHTDMGYPLVVGPDCTVGHQATLHGCTIGAGSLIGIGATILNGAVIGESCIVGAHAFIAEGKTIPPRSLVVGAPGKVVRAVTDAEVKKLRQSAAHYVNQWRRHAAGLTRL